MLNLLLSADELVALTGYRQRHRQVQWLRSHLHIEPPLRADGRPVVSRAQVENALGGQRQEEPAAANGPRWTKKA